MDPQNQSPQMPPQPMGPPPMYGAPQQSVPGKGLSIAGFVLALIGLFTFGFTSLIGLILSIMGRSQSKKAGQPNGLALAGIIVSAFSMVIGVIVGIIFLAAFVWGAGEISQLNEQCKELGPGVHTVEWLGDSDAQLTCDDSSEYSDIQVSEEF